MILKALAEDRETDMYALSLMKALFKENSPDAAVKVFKDNIDRA